MIAFIALSALMVVVSAQYQHQGYQPQQAYRPAPQQAYQQPQEYQQQAPAQQYQPPPQAYQPQQTRSYNPAAVHYVNIGAQLQGDYKFGYDTGKGNDGQSFREETRLPDGSVQGAYGYIDSTGQQRIIKYTAGKDGYRAEGDGVPKAPAAPVAQAAPAQRNYNAYDGNSNSYPAVRYQ